MATAVPFCDCTECQFGSDPAEAAQQFIAVEAKNGMFDVTRVRTCNGSDDSDWGRLGYNDILAARAYGTMNITEIMLQACGGCGDQMAFEDRKAGQGMYGYVHTACGHSGKYR